MQLKNAPCSPRRAPGVPPDAKTSSGGERTPTPGVPTTPASPTSSPGVRGVAHRRAPAGPGTCLVVYAVAVLVGGALVAPPAHWAGRALVHAQWLPQLAKFGFNTYLRRSWLLVALGLLPALMRCLPPRALAWRPGAAHPGQAVRQLGLGLGLGGLGVGTLLMALTAQGWFVWRALSPGAWALALVSAAASAAAVATVEELSFRGVLQRSLARSMPHVVAAALQVGAFAAVHFVAAPGAAPVPTSGPVVWDTGLRALAAAFAPLGHLGAHGTQAATLLAVGAALTLASRRGGTLWPAIGLHAAWTFGLRLAAQACARVRPADAWLDHELRAGLLPSLLALATVAAVALLPRTWLRGGRGRQT